MGKRIEITQHELECMRANGMTNTDIANALGCSYTYVYKKLGPQPGMVGWHAMNISLDENTPVEPVEKPKTLMLTKAMITLEGRQMYYSISKNTDVVKLTDKDTGDNINFEIPSIGAIISELQEVMIYVREMQKARAQ